MTDERQPWVGDLIHDKDADRRGIVTDVRVGAVWVLRPERLVVVTPSAEMRKQP
ncbi:MULTISPECIES: hypothetical protein [Streptomyces]|uniref:Uncharacterized protein n=2 Tax=Streptomyces TaxID=1883 RepID=A0ABV9J089_9ACTN